MKIFSKICITFLILFTLIIFWSGVAMLFVKIKINSIDGTSYYETGFQYFKENGIWNTLKYWNHSYVDDSLNPNVPAIDPSTGENTPYTSALFVSSALNLSLIATPILIIVSTLVIIKLLKSTHFPVSEEFIKKIYLLKKQKKVIKKNYKSLIKNLVNKNTLHIEKSKYKIDIIKIKSDKKEIKFQIKKDYKIKKQNQKIMNEKIKK